MYALPDPANFANGTTIAAGGFKTLMDFAPASSYRGTRVTLPKNYLDGGDPRPNPSTPPTDPPISSAQWLSPRADGKGWWTPCDSYWNTGQWIDTPTKHGFVAILSAFGGRVYYMSSDVWCDTMQFELHIYDPAQLGRVAQGLAQPNQIAPTYMVELTLPGMSNQGERANLTNAMAIGGATFDAVSKRLYIMGMGINHYTTINRLFVYQVNA
jgi:hypothetical protein